MTKKYSYTQHSEVPVDLVDYVLNIANINNINELTIEEINDFLNEVDEFLSDEWPWQDSGIESGF